MIRGLACLLFLAVSALAAAPAAAEALLRQRVIVEGPTVTLGDLFDNVGDKAPVAVMRSPAPGQRVSVDGDWLAHVALINGISWHPRGLFEEAAIERSGVVIAREQVLASLQRALQQRGAGGDFQIDIEGRQQQMVVPVGSPAELTVRDLYYNRQDQRFTATVAVPQGGVEVARMIVSGRLVQTIQLPVLNRTVAHGDVIAAADITFVTLRETELRPNLIRDPDQMVGMTPKQQTLRPGQAVIASELQRPLAVARGAIVTMVLSHGGMALTAQGRAIDQGSLGEVIRVSNTHSNLTVEGTVDGPNHIRVTLGGGPVALAN
jgi:flagella basal body P-ring formation protein FlgA